jgi:DnaJ-class molecular chaperone
MADETTEEVVLEDVDLQEVYRFVKFPERLELGAVARCYRCDGRGNEPGSKKKPCSRCRGMGIIPNKGPIP